MRLLANGSIRVPETPADLVLMYEWIDRQHTLALDTETTGLDIYSDDHRIRLIALANPQEAWVFPAERMMNSSIRVMERLQGKRLIMHNAPYDIQVLARHGLGQIEALFAQTRDTKNLAHQVDPRGRDEGGIGQSLDELVKYYMPEYAKLGDDLKAEFARLKQLGVIPKSTPVAKMWVVMPLDNEMFLVYAGTDAILTARLFKILKKLVDTNSELTKSDHKTSMIASIMDATGFLLDVDYTTELRNTLLRDEQKWKNRAFDLGLENINSPQQVAEALERIGLVPAEKTPKGNPKVDKVFLGQHYEVPLVQAIVEGKKAGKWRTTWVEKFLGAADSDGRVHPSTNTLRARTARFSITGIPAQTLPSSDSLVRSCFVADTDEIIVGADYSQQELRFAAAHSKDGKLIRVFRDGADPYLTVAEMAHPGDGLRYRKAFKTGVLGTLFGAGTRALSTQTGMSEREAQMTINAIRKGYSGLDRRAQELAREAEKNGYITTWTGRRLPVEPNRLYSAMNYYTQSGSRDITAQAMQRLYDAGYVEFMRLAIHDELLFSLPVHEPWMIKDIEKIMSTSYGKVLIPAEAKIGSRSWGSLYEEA